MIQPPLRIGTAGWNVPSSYAAEIPAGGSHLERYARRLNAAEINSSFHRPHQRKTYERWARSTPADFRFSVKIPKAMTHERGLIDCGALLDRFAAEVTGLGDKLAILLVQLPPKFVRDELVADRFLNDLRARLDVPVALEPRNASWFTPDADRWLAERRIARVAADPAKPDGAGEPGGWRGLAYYRQHGAPLAKGHTHLADAHRDQRHGAAVNVDRICGHRSDRDAEQGEVVDRVGHRLLQLHGWDVSRPPLSSGDRGQRRPGQLQDHA